MKSNAKSEVHVRPLPPPKKEEVIVLAPPGTELSAHRVHTVVSNIDTGEYRQAPTQGGFFPRQVQEDGILVRCDGMCCFVPYSVIDRVRNNPEVEVKLLE